MADSVQTKKPEAVVHSACARPVIPPVGMVWHNPNTKYDEVWDGLHWQPKLPETLSGAK